MKKILRITLESIEVPDDYSLQESNNPDDNKIISEVEGYAFITTQRTEDDFQFLSLDADLNQISVLTEFIHWANISWQGFYGELPPKLRRFMHYFLSIKDHAVTYANDYLKRIIDRHTEVETGMVNFRRWDPEIFERPDKYFSVN